MRNVIDVEIAARLRVPGLTKHKHIRPVVDIPQKADGTIEWRISRLLPARRRKEAGIGPIMFLHINSAKELDEWRVFPDHIRDKARINALLLEDLLSLGERATIRYRVFCYDEFSGARRVFFSKPYTIHDIKEGRFKANGLDVIETASQVQQEISEEISTE